MTGNLGSNYWKLWSANTVSNFGDGIAMVAYPWLASSVTRDPVEIALIAVASRLPWFLFTLPAGVITDRVDRRRIVVTLDIFRSALTLGVAVAVFVGPTLPTPADLGAGIVDESTEKFRYLALLYVSAFLFGMAEVLRDNAAQTLMPSLVNSSQLQSANSRLWGAQTVMNSFLGRPVAGLLIAISLPLPFFVDAATFVISAILIFAIHGEFKPQIAQEEVSRTSGWFEDMKEGFVWLWHRALFRDLAIILGIINAMTMMALATYVLFVQEVLQLSASQFGVLMTAGAIGGVLGSILASRVSTRLGPGRSLLLTIVVSTTQFAVTGMTSSATMVWVMFLIGAFGSVLWNVITVSLRQQAIPNDLLGRVNSVYRFFALGMMPIGTLLGGAIVVASELMTSREVALRMPFFIAAGVYALLIPIVASRLTDRKIEAARA